MSALDFHSEADRFALRSKDFLTLKKKFARTNVLARVARSMVSANQR